MDIGTLYRWGVAGVLVAAALILPILFFVTAPYGRHAREGWGPGIPSRIAWVLMELPAPLCFALVYFRGPVAYETVPLALLALWQLHYLQRTLIFPMLMRPSDKRTPIATFLLALCFNVANGALNALAVSHLGGYADSWLSDPRFAIGACLFLAGFGINVHSDHVLRTLRAPGESGYKIPRAGFYRWVSAANYFGEIVEWIGWAVATWSAAGLAFALFTIANLLPRALSHHRWYRERFPDYPARRKAVLPGLL